MRRSARPRVCDLHRLPDHAEQAIRRIQGAAKKGRLMLCLRCHRALKDPQSILNGYGPICWRIVQEDPGEAFTDWEHYEEPDKDMSA